MESAVRLSIALGSRKCWQILKPDTAAIPFLPSKTKRLPPSYGWLDGVVFCHLILGKRKAGNRFWFPAWWCPPVGGWYSVLKVRGRLARWWKDWQTGILQRLFRTILCTFHAKNAFCSIFSFSRIICYINIHWAHTFTLSAWYTFFLITFNTQ